MPEPTVPDGELPVDALVRIDELCSRFEDEWTADAHPPIREYLDDVPEAQRPHLFRELLLAILERHKANSVEFDSEEYHSKFPEYVPILRDVLSDQRTNDGRSSSTVGVEQGLEPGSMLGPYEVVEFLGQGGMGTVYRAKDSRLGREVAVKVLPGKFSEDAERLARFEREARAVSRLSHPNVVVLYDVGWHGKTFFVVMELLRGETLRERLDRAPLTREEAIDLAEGIARALAAVHAEGVIHRDLKPANLFITEAGRVKILDFGLARIDNVTKVTPLSAPNVILGTAGYMAPEQVLGRPAGPKSDLFALGCVLHEMLTGQRAFTGDTPGATMATILHEEPPAFHDGGLPRPLLEILSGCLAKDSDRRFESADELADALRATTKPEGQSIGTSRRVWVWVGVAVVLVAVAAIVLLWRGKKSEETAIRSLAVLPFTWQGDARHPAIDSYRHDVPLVLIQRMRRLPGLEVRSFRAVSGLSSAPERVENAFEELGVDAVVRGVVRQSGESISFRAELVRRGGTVLWSREFEYRPDSMLEVHDEIARALGAQLSDKPIREIEKIGTKNPEALSEYVQGRVAWGRRSSEQMQIALGHFDKAVSLDPDYAEAHAGRALCYITLGERNITLPERGILSPRHAYDKARQSANEASRRNPKLSDARTALGMIAYEYDWEFGRAEDEFSRALALDPHNQTALQWYAEYLSAMGRHKEALAHIERARRSDHPKSAIVNTVEGVLLYKAGRIDDAIAKLKQTLAEHRSFSRGHGYLALIYEEKHELDKAVDHWHIATAGDDKLIGPLREAAHSSDPNAYWKKRLELREALTGPNGHYPLSPVYEAMLHIRLGRYDEAFRILRKAEQDKDGALVPNLAVNPSFRALLKNPATAERYRKFLTDMTFDESLTRSGASR